MSGSNVLIVNESSENQKEIALRDDYRGNDYMKIKITAI